MRTLLLISALVVALFSGSREQSVSDTERLEAGRPGYETADNSPDFESVRKQTACRLGEESSLSGLSLPRPNCRRTAPGTAPVHPAIRSVHPFAGIKADFRLSALKEYGILSPGRYLFSICILRL